MIGKSRIHEGESWATPFVVSRLRCINQNDESGTEEQETCTCLRGSASMKNQTKSARPRYSTERVFVFRHFFRHVIITLISLSNVKCVSYGKDVVKMCMYFKYAGNCAYVVIMQNMMINASALMLRNQLRDVLAIVRIHTGIQGRARTIVLSRVLGSTRTVWLYCVGLARVPNLARYEACTM